MKSEIKKTIIGFDNWAAGSHHFERLVPAFEKRGYRLILIHIGSWGHDKGRPNEEFIGNLMVRDISFYHGKSFLEILRLEKPSAILFLSTRPLAFMAFNRYASFLGIPTCHLYHGLLAVQPIEIGKSPYEVSAYRVFRTICKRIVTNLTRLIPVYCKSLVITKAPFKAWAILIREIYEKATWKIYNVAPADSKTTIGCVYTPADISHITTVYHVPKDKIFTVGLPDLISFDVKRPDLAYGLTRELVNAEVVYIDGCQISGPHVRFDTPAQYCEFLKNTCDVLAAFGFTLVVKLHPANYSYPAVPEQLKKLGVEVCEGGDFMDRLKKARFVITEPSTAAMIPALLGLPLFLCQYEEFASLSYGKALVSYPRSRYLTQLTDIPALLEEEQKSLVPQMVHDWIGSNSGPMPAVEMPERVATAIDSMIKGQ